MRQWLQVLLANHCALCGSATPHSLCPGCAQSLPRLGLACPCCALPLSGQSLACPDCQILPKSFGRTHCAFIYGYPLDGLIRQFKHQRQFHLGRYLSEYLAQTLTHAGPMPQALVPMPQSRQRRLWRGFNQAHFIAEHLQKRTGLPLIRVSPVHAGGEQKYLSRQARLATQGRALAHQQAVVGKHLLIVDDVMTTGASALRLSQALLADGAAAVDVAVLARTPKA